MRAVLYLASLLRDSLAMRVGRQYACTGSCSAPENPLYQVHVACQDAASFARHLSSDRPTPTFHGPCTTQSVPIVIDHCEVCNARHHDRLRLHNDFLCYIERYNVHSEVLDEAAVMKRIDSLERWFPCHTVHPGQLLWVTELVICPPRDLCEHALARVSTSLSICLATAYGYQRSTTPVLPPRLLTAEKESETSTWTRVWELSCIQTSSTCKVLYAALSI